MSLASDQDFLAELLYDTEKQLADFNDIIPFKYNKNVFSPRLVNLHLTTCSQIEALCGLFITELNLMGPSGNGMKDVMLELDVNGVLSNMKIDWYSLGETFSPFTTGYDWWVKYNKTKHKMVAEAKNLKYSDVANGLAALAGLHRLASAMRLYVYTKNDILDKTKWVQDGGDRFVTKLFVIDTMFFSQRKP
ncbi:MAG: hypothetical protein AB1753_10295 [Thermoproteota archaeon]